MGRSFGLRSQAQTQIKMNGAQNAVLIVQSKWQGHIEIQERKPVNIYEDSLNMIIYQTL